MKMQQTCLCVRVELGKGAPPRQHEGGTRVRRAAGGVIMKERKNTSGSHKPTERGEIGRGGQEEDRR